MWDDDEVIELRPAGPRFTGIGLRVAGFASTVLACVFLAAAALGALAYGRSGHVAVWWAVAFCLAWAGLCAWCALRSYEDLRSSGF